MSPLAQPEPPRQERPAVISLSALNAEPLGRLWLAAAEAGVLGVQIGGDGRRYAARLERRWGLRPRSEPDSLAELKRQLRQYLAGERPAFELALLWGPMDDFQRQVLEAAMAIPYGQVRTYGRLAASLGHEVSAARAVGRALAANPMPIIVPCHRVVGSDGELRGYAAPGGVATKAWLLRLEGRPVGVQSRLPW